MLRFFVTAVALLAVASLTAVSAQEATPTPTPVPTSAITIRFVSDGEPVEVILNAPLHRLLADGVDCTPPVPQEVGPSTGYSIRWPLIGIPEAEIECRKGPPTTLRFEFNNGGEILSTEFVWSGSDTHVDLEVPSSRSRVISEIPLPPAGAAPAEDTGGSRWFGLGLMAAGLIAASLGAMTWRLGRR